MCRTWYGLTGFCLNCHFKMCSLKQNKISDKSLILRFQQTSSYLLSCFCWLNLSRGRKSLKTHRQTQCWLFLSFSKLIECHVAFSCSVPSEKGHICAMSAEIRWWWQTAVIRRMSCWFFGLLWSFLSMLCDQPAWTGCAASKGKAVQRALASFLTCLRIVLWCEKLLRNRRKNRFEEAILWSPHFS